MTIPLFPVTMLQFLLGRLWPEKQNGEPHGDAARAHEAEYARRVGYRLGANGEWIAERATECRGDEH